MWDTLYEYTKDSVFCRLVLSHSHTYRHSHLGDLNNFYVHLPILLIRRRGTDYGTQSTCICYTFAYTFAYKSNQGF